MNNTKKIKISSMRLRVYIISVVLLIIFALQLRWVMLYFISNFYFNDIIIVIPTIIAIFMLITTFTGLYEKHETIRFFTKFFLIIAIVAMCFHWFLFLLGANSQKTYNPADYPKVLNLCSYSKNKYVSHFPKSLTDDMKDIRMEYNTFAYNTNHAILIYKTTPEALSYIKESLYDQRKYSSSDEILYLTENNILSIDSMYIEKGEESLTYLPNDFTIWVFDYNIKQKDIKTASKVYIYGIAFSDERCEILYFYETHIND